MAPSTLVAARVIAHQPAAQRKYEEVKNEIGEMLRRREALTTSSQGLLMEGMRRLDEGQRSM